MRNPRDLSRVPGGSSGGSAAAVAADMAVATLGSDTGGSIRQPASFCGVVGLMPTYGRVSRYGLIAFASSLDHIGPLTKTVKDAAMVLRAIAGRDPMDSTSADVPVPDYVAELEKPVRGLRLGVAKEYFGEGLDAGGSASGREAQFRSWQNWAAKWFPCRCRIRSTRFLRTTCRNGGSLVEPRALRWRALRYRAPTADTLSEMYRRSRDEGFGTEVKRRIMLGTYALSAGYYDAYYLKAQKVRTLLTRDFDEAFKKVDAIVTPDQSDACLPLGRESRTIRSPCIWRIFIR